jgi:hypothetical protein
LFSAREFFRGAAEMKNGGVLAFDHFRAQLDFQRAPVAGVGDKPPDGGRAGLEGGQVFEVERREKAVGIDPGADAFRENMAVHRHGGIQICAERAVVFGIHAAQINAEPRHAAAAVGEQDEVRGLRLGARGGGFGREKMDGGGNFLRNNGVALQK